MFTCFCPIRSEPYSSAPEEYVTKYSTGTVAAVGLFAFAAGTLLFFAAKMSYTLYRRRTYGNIFLYQLMGVM